MKRHELELADIQTSFPKASVSEMAQPSGGSSSTLTEASASSFPCDSDAYQPMLNPRPARSPWRRLAKLACAGLTCLCVLVALLFVFLFVGDPQSSFVPYDLHAGPSAKPINATLEKIPELLDELDIAPLRCHSHNDYNRKNPIVSALIAGCIGIEAGIWLAEGGQDVLVGHTRGSATRTLRDMYLDPLLQMMDLSNNRSTHNDSADCSGTARGLFSKRVDTPIVLLVDVKQSGRVAAEAWQIVLQQLEPFRRKGYLHHYESGAVHPGPLVVVASGEMTLGILLSSTASQGTPYQTYHDTFLDAPLRELGPLSDASWRARYNDSNSYYASVSLSVAIRSPSFGFSRSRYDILRRQLRVARESGLYSRYWNLPRWPVKYRDYVWSVLVRKEIGMLNVDDVTIRPPPVEHPHQ